MIIVIAMEREREREIDRDTERKRDGKTERRRDGETLSDSPTFSYSKKLCWS